MSETRSAEGSPAPESPSRSSVLRPTRASEARASQSRPSEVGMPTQVQDIAAMPAMERIKREHDAKLSRMKEHASKRKSTGGFGGSSPRNDTNTAPARTETARRKREADEAARIKLLQEVGEMPERPDPRAQKAPATSTWAKSGTAGDRHQFQRPWPSKAFPASTPQSSMTGGGPGPGAYAKSRSHLV